MNEKLKIDDQLIRQTLLSYITAMLLIMVGVLFVVPKFNDLVKVKRQVAELEGKIEGLTKSLDVLDQFEGVISQTDQELLYGVIPASFNPGVILSNLRLISRNLGINIVSYRLGGGVLEVEGSNGQEEVKKGGGKQTASRLKINQLELELAGSTEAVMSFTKLVEKSVPLGNITKVSVAEITKMISSVDGRDLVSMSMVIDYYHLPVKGDRVPSLESYTISEADRELMEQLRGYQRLSGVVPGSEGIRGGNRNLFGD